MDACNNPDVLRVIMYVKILLKYVFILVPMGLILMMGLDFFKNVVAGKEDDMSKNTKLSLKRLIFCVALFFVPTIVSLVVKIIDDSLEIDTSYISCITNAESSIIEEKEADYAWNIVEEAKASNDFNKIEEALAYVNRIKDEEKKKEYKEVIELVKEEIIADAKLKQQEEENVRPSVSPNGSSNTNINNMSYDEDTVNLLAAGIGMEAGGYPDGFKSQLITGAVMINNLYTTISRGRKGAIKSSASNITYDDIKNLFSYCPVYCNSGGSKWNYIKVKGGGIEYLKSTGATDAMINQLQVIAKILLSKEFTIPQHILGQGVEADWAGVDFTVWGKATTGTRFGNVTFAAVNNTGLDESKDVYGNTVSKNFSDYNEIANNLYSKYIDK